MSKDVKIEIIYYKTATDVSLEFGLHDQYPLRLLSSCCNDLKSFFKSLKRAVMRSEIILLVGGYDDEKEYLPGFLARSIGQKCVIPDYGKLGVIASNHYILPKDAKPLAPKSRLFGGFLIEHGPQTIISLTDDQKIRNELVKQFIASYITEHHNSFNSPFVLKPDVEKVENEKTEQSTEYTDISSNGDNADTPETNTVVLEETTNETVLNLDDFDVPLIFENEDNIENSDSDDSDDNGNDDSIFIYEIEKNYTHRKRRAVRIWCIILSLLVVLSTVAGALSTKFIGKGEDYYKKLNQIYNSHGDDISSGFQKVKQRNNAIFTWLKFDSIGINHPAFSVVDASKNEYLNRLPNGTEDVRGTLYSEFVGSLTSSVGNAIIYGNSANGGLLQEVPANLEELLGSEFTAADNRFLTNWQVFSVFKESSVNGYDYWKTDFDNDDAYREHLIALQNLSIGNFEKTLYGNEKLLIIVGIGTDDKFVLAACLDSVRVLMITNETVNSSVGNQSHIDSSLSDSTVSSNTLSSEPDDSHTGDHNDFHGDSPDIILPPPPVTSSSPSSSNASSSKPSSSTVQSSNTSSQNSSNDTSTKVSSVIGSSSVVSSVPSSTQSTSSGNTSSHITSAEPSRPDVTSSQTSSTVTSSKPSSVVASSSSQASSSQPPKPTVDPIYTWDVELSCIDNATGIKYTGKAVDIVAMILEDEMSPTIDPPEALIAQSVVKYNWLLNNNGLNPNKAPSNALDPNPTPQAIKYATAAKGMVLMYGNTVAKTYCYAYSAGKTACYQDIWGGTAYPYLQSVDCSIDEQLKDFKTTSTYSAAKMQELIKTVCGIDVSEMPKTEWLVPTKRDANGLYCLKIKIGGKEYNGRYLRETLLAKKNTNMAAIRSTAYEIEYNEEQDAFTVTCKGYGHGVGFSQRGAKAYAKEGWTAEQLLAHFFPGTTLIKN